MGSSDVSLGIDVGGSGIKGAPVDLTKGKFSDKRLRIPTPAGAKPEDVVDTIAEVVSHFKDLPRKAPVGVTIPGVVMHGVVQTAANIDKSWIGFDAEKALEDKLGRDVTVVNDADAAGVAEMHYGAAKGRSGVVILATLGTGIGTAIINDGVLVPNSELGHIEIDGHDAETRASSAAQERESLSWEAYAERLTAYFSHLEALVWPDLLLVGGGVSKESENFLPLVKIRTPILPAVLLNKAGIIGAAHLATNVSTRHKKRQEQRAGT